MVYHTCWPHSFQKRYLMMQMGQNSWHAETLFISARTRCCAWTRNNESPCRLLIKTQIRFTESRRIWWWLIRNHVINGRTHFGDYQEGSRQHSGLYYFCQNYGETLNTVRTEVVKVAVINQEKRRTWWRKQQKPRKSFPEHGLQKASIRLMHSLSDFLHHYKHTNMALSSFDIASVVRALEAYVPFTFHTEITA